MELGGPAESWSPDEGASGVSEALSEEARQRFAAGAAAAKKARKQEKKSKKRDDQVAKVIIQFLGDDQHAHLFVLISRLVARDCPSIFILAILSLIHNESREMVEQYLEETFHITATEAVDESTSLTKTGELDPDMNKAMVDWITRLQMVLSVGASKILLTLMIDEKNIDGTVLQLTTFVVKDFFELSGRNASFEKVQPLTANILQAVLEPFIADVQRAYLAAAPQDTSDEDDD